MILGPEALQTIQRAGASPIRRFDNWRCSRGDDVFDEDYTGNHKENTLDTINKSHGDLVILLMKHEAVLTPLWSIQGYLGSWKASPSLMYTQSPTSKWIGLWRASY